MAQINPLNEQEAEAWKARLSEALEYLRDERLPFIEGIRKVLAIANEPRERDEDFDLFVAIDSETDRLPQERSRSQCTKEWLAKCDREAEEARALYREAVRESIDQILAKLHSS